MSNIMTVAIQAAQDAGAFLKDNFGKVKEVEVKRDASLATNVDRSAEQIIVGRIRTAFPTHNIMAEEGGESLRDAGYWWIIDPLDGTHNFIRGMEAFGVSVGVVNGDEFIAGVIYMPMSGELYAAEKGSGAYKNNNRIFVSKTADISRAFLSFDSTMRNVPDDYFAILRRVGKSVFSVRMTGSSVRVLSYLAEGKLDGTVEFFDHPWDFAGGVTILREAGGVLRGLDSGELKPRSTGYIGSNGLLQDALEKIVCLQNPSSSL